MVGNQGWECLSGSFTRAFNGSCYLFLSFSNKVALWGETYLLALCGNSLQPLFAPREQANCQPRKASEHETHESRKIGE